jgi:hypothetical protein
MLQMVMHVCSMAQEVAENLCERNHQEQVRRGVNWTVLLTMLQCQQKLAVLVRINLTAQEQHDNLMRRSTGDADVLRL